ncbi:hypothetical protein HDU93_009223 [Gonapodya sp. JEL0774]|nr:hypothetical protein HDU93_009223 [Gonapodya sp. JEL0774]
MPFQKIPPPDGQFTEVDSFAVDVGGPSDMGDSPSDAPAELPAEPLRAESAGSAQFAGFIDRRDTGFDAHNAKTWIPALHAYMTDKRRVLVRAVAGEFLVTFLFLFVVMSVGVNFRRANPTEADATLGGISTAFCAVALIYSFADVSGAHFNPAVTMGTIVTGKVSVKKGLWFIGIQLFAAVMSTLWLQVVFPPHNGFNASEIAAVDFGDQVVIGRAFAMEATLTFILVYVIFATAFETVDTSNKVVVKPLVDGAQKTVSVNANGTGREISQSDSSVGKNLTIYTTSANSKSGFAPLAIGLTLGFLCFLGGSVSGGAFNPARVFVSCMNSLPLGKPGSLLLTSSHTTHHLKGPGEFHSWISSF